MPNIKSWKQWGLYPDFKNIGQPCSDIDFITIGKNYMLLAEIKNEHGTMYEGQKWVYEQFAKNHKTPVYILFVTHDKMIENGDKTFDMCETDVVEQYNNMDNEWVPPSRPVKFKEYLAWLNEFSKNFKF